MNKIALLNFEEGGDEIVFGGGVGLDDVASLSAHVQVPNRYRIGNARRTRRDAEHEAAILERASGLVDFECDCVVGSLVL